MARMWPTRRALYQADGGAVSGGIGSGLFGGLLASLCCLPPALALVLGLGGSAFVSLGAYQTQFHLAGLALTVAAAWWILRRRAHACRVDRNPLPFLLLAVGTFVGSYLILTYVVTPFLYGIYASR